MGAPREQPPGAGQNVGAQGWVPMSMGRSDPILVSLQPSHCAGHRGRVWMWHPEGTAPYFGGGTCVLQDSCLGVWVSAWQGRS